ncbi:MAG TPA: ATP-binding protein [Polyangia bacterium]|nr:ATP-binding protein [Polyangia bacterium]
MRRLYTRIYWHFIVLLIVVAGVMSVVFSAGRTALLREYSERVAKHTAALLGPAWRDPERRDRLLRHLSDELDLDLTLRTPDGALVIAVGSELPAPVDADLAAAREGAHFVKRAPRGWYVIAPVRDADTRAVVGLLETTHARHFGYASLMRPALIVGAVLLLIAIGTAPLARRISRPVERLTEASRRLGSGDLAYRIKPPRRWRHRHRPHDELAELTRTWNEMAERIEGLVRGHRELLANVSHELRSPLQRIRLALEMLPEELAPQVDVRLRDVKIDLAELERLIDDVLTTSRLEATGLPTHVERVDVGGLLEQLGARAKIDPITTGKRVEVAAPAAIELQADGALVKRALWNLVENAAKYGAPPIRIEAALRGERVELSVTDDGPGIAPGDRERVLDAFYRADKARTAGAAHGFGLGLTLARRVAEVHGGAIRVEPARAEAPIGCRITLELPLRAA